MKSNKSADFHIIEPAIDQWSLWIGDWLASESLARATIVADQLRGAKAVAQQGHGCPLVSLAYCNPQGQVESAVLYSPPKTGCDAATLLCASGIGPSANSASLSTLAHALHERWVREGVKIAFWSTETQDNELGFRRLAELRYLQTTVKRILKTRDQAFHSPDVHSRALKLLPFADPSAAEVEECVSQTYVDSLDCAVINQYRTARQTIAGYQTSALYSPEHWYRCVDPSTGQDVGCVLLAIHPSVLDTPAPHNDDTSEDSAFRCTAEIVYMGLLPKHRGRGLGRQIVYAVAQTVQKQASQIILAVDRANQPAADLYRSLTFTEVFRERLWFWHESFAQMPKTDQHLIHQSLNS
jgi:ribosomal protein S18 acetylase RimI-like enzyme